MSDTTPVADTGRGSGNPLGLRYDSTVPRHLVHRWASSEVLLTDWSPGGHDGYHVAARWSRCHRVYRALGGRRDPLLLGETLRQSAILFSHIALHVPVDHSLIMDRISWSAAARGIPEDGARTVVGRVRISEPRPRTRAVVALRIDLDLCSDDGAPLGSASGWARCVSPSIFVRLRASGVSSRSVTIDVPPAVDRTSVGACRDDDVVLAGPSPGRSDDGSGEWRLRVRTDHAVHFDHPQDHVPGMLVLDGMRQAGRVLCGWPEAHMTRCDVAFDRYLELDAPSYVGAVLTADHDDVVELRTYARQADAATATGSVTMQNAARPG